MFRQNKYVMSLVSRERKMTGKQGHFWNQVSGSIGSMECGRVLIAPMGKWGNTSSASGNLLILSNQISVDGGTALIIFVFADWRNCGVILEKNKIFSQ